MGDEEKQSSVHRCLCVYSCTEPVILNNSYYDLFLQGSAEYDGSVADEAGTGSGCGSSPESVDFAEDLRCDHTAPGIGLLFSLYLRTSRPFYYFCFFALSA